MAQQLKGVSGVLGNIISAEPQKPSPERPAENPESRNVSRGDVPDQPDQQKKEEKVSGPSKKNGGGARRGRPPKPPRTSEPIEREKVSLRLRADLAAIYRDWSWEERCQFSELVDRAMEFYLRHREKGRKPEKT
jgi:hypothetical protein